jgi:hypothetical protein
MKCSVFLIAATMMIFPPLLCSAQSQEKIYSSLILNFARGIQWPSMGPSEKFIIGVLEYQPLAAELTAMVAYAKVAGKKIDVREFTNADEIKNCNMVFIPAYKARQFSTVITQLGTDPTLIITNKMDYAKKGAGVNFVLVDGKLKYEINCRSIEKRGMKISANVKGMGIVVD